MAFFWPLKVLKTLLTYFNHQIKCKTSLDCDVTLFHLLFTEHSYCNVLYPYIIVKWSLRNLVLQWSSGRITAVSELVPLCNINIRIVEFLYVWKTQAAIVPLAYWFWPAARLWPGPAYENIFGWPAYKFHTSIYPA